MERIIASAREVKFQAPFVFFDSASRRRELDAFAVTEPQEGSRPLEVFVFEIKRRFKDKHINQIRSNITALRETMHQYRECPIYPYLLAGSITERQRQKVWDAGIHLVSYGSSLFELPVPPAAFEFDCQTGIQKRPEDLSRPRRSLPVQHPPFYLVRLKRIRDAVESGKLH